jgi:esterase/lipase
MNRFSTWVALLIGMTTLVGAMFALDSRYAKTEEISTIKDYVQQIDKRLDIKILKDRANALQERMWKIEDRYGMEVAEMSEEVRDQYRELKKEYDEIMELIKKDKKDEEPN